MNDAPENELLSAYLDGELTAAEQADVDQLLARSPAARELLVELRALSSQLRALPRRKLGEDLSQEVLQTARQRMLSRSAASGELRQPVPSRLRAILRRLVKRRALVWTSLGMAIAVILAVMDRGSKKELAVTPPAPPTVDEKRGHTPEIAPPQQKADREGKLAGGRPAVTSGQVEESLKAGAESAADQYRAKNGTTGLAETRGSAGFTPGAVQGERHVAEKAPAILGEPIGEGTAGSPPVQWDLLVQCQISPVAHGKEVFDKALADNGIVWDEAPAGSSVLGGNATVVQEHRLEQVTQQKSEEINQPGVEIETLPAGGGNLVYVEAPWVQMKGLLTALKIRQDAVSFVSSQSAAAAEMATALGWNVAGQVRLPESGGTGAVRGLQTQGAMVKTPVAPPEQRPEAGHEGQDRLGLRAFARRLQPPVPGSDLAAKSGRYAAPPGEPPKSAAVGPTAPLQQSRQPERTSAGQPGQQKTRGRDAEVPPVRALFVLHMADLKPGTASVEAKPDTSKAAAASHKAAPPAEQ